jgi:hypothetical protein
MLLQRWKVGLFLMGVSLLLTGILAAQDATPVPTQDPAMMPTEDSMATPEATLEGDVVGISNDMTGNATITETIPFNSQKGLRYTSSQRAWAIRVCCKPCPMEHFLLLAARKAM